MLNRLIIHKIIFNINNFYIFNEKNIISIVKITDVYGNHYKYIYNSFDGKLHILNNNAINKIIIIYYFTDNIKNIRKEKYKLLFK